MDIKNSSIIDNINNENYLSNCYRRLIRSKTVHFLFILIEIILILLQEIDIFNRGYKPRYKTEGKVIINPIILLIHLLDNLQQYINFLIILLSMFIFDFLYILLSKKDIKEKNIIISIIINFLELFYFRIYVNFFFCLLFSLKKLYLLLSFIISLPHIYIIINNFFYNHLYYYVPDFVDYPYDQFSSNYDLFLFLSKIILSVASSANQIELGKFCFVIIFIFQIFFCFYFIEKLINHSYLFMKNSFLNRTKISLFLAETTIMFFTYFIGEKQLFNFSFVLISVGIIIIYIGFIYFIYDPYSYIHINNERPLENMLYYLNMINKKNDIEFLIENELNNHYKNCGLCDMCKKYEKYRTENESENIEQNESKNEEDSLLITNENNKNKIINLFDLLYDDKKKYFKFIKNILKNYKKMGKNIFNNNVYYYINLSYLIYSDYLNNDITLSLNEKIILEIINQENYYFLENHQSQINKLILSNEFISLGKKILSLIKNILNDNQNFFKAKKLIVLSKLLKTMKKKEYKNNLFNHKLENITNSKNILIACSIIYEEIFNTTINNSQIAIRDNIQQLEDIFSNSNKNNNIITLEIDLINYNCKIIRAGKGLYSYINKNLFDLFPHFIKQQHKNLFLNSIFTGFNNEEENFDENNVNNNKKLNKKNKNKKEFVEIKVVLYENVLDKIYYKLLTLRLTSLFNNKINHLILFNGSYTFNNNILVTLIDLSHKNEVDEKVLGVFDPDFENESKYNYLSSFPLKKYISSQSFKRYKLKKLYSYKISVKLYNIYILEIKNGGIIRKKEINKKDIIESNESDNNSEEIENNKNRIKIYEETNSVTSSVQTSTYSKKINSIGIKKIKKNNIINHTGFYGIQKIIYFSIFLVIVIILIEYLYFDKVKQQTNNNNNSYINYRGFFRLYYQLFASILGVACIPEKIDSKNCRNFISIFNKVYSTNYPNETFDFTEYLLIQNEILAEKIAEERDNIIKINDYIGEKRYSEIFSTKIKYIQIEHKIINQNTIFSTKETDIDFFDAIIILCNSFGILTENKKFVLTQPIYFLNKLENPFINLYNQNEMSDYQEEVYKMILNYKYYSKQFSDIDQQLYQFLNEKSKFIKILIFLFINLNVVLYLIIAILIYSFLICFKTIIMKVLNYVIMIINNKSDSFDFKTIFTQKIENLNIILELYGSSPFEAIQNLNMMYNNYNQYLINKNKATIINANKKSLIRSNYREDQNEFDEIPKKHQIITLKDINKLNIHNIYQIILIILILLILIIYICFLLLWINYFSKRTYLFNIISKNAKLEKSCYEAVNIYELMIFHNYTLDEMINYLELSPINENNNTNHDSNLIFNSFYQDLYLVFDLEKDQRYMGDLYQDFEDLAEFNCINMVVTFHYEILEEVDEIMTELDLKQKLVDICVISHITESKNIKTIFERHFQFMKNGMLSLTDFSYEGLNKNLDSTIIGRIAFFFFTTTIYIIEVTTSKPHKESINKMMNLLGFRLLITEIIFLVFGVALILIILFFYIYNINKFCNQIFLLKKTFNIFEMQEQ